MAEKADVGPGGAVGGKPDEVFDVGSEVAEVVLRKALTKIKPWRGTAA